VRQTTGGPVCERPPVGVTPLDGLIGAGLMIGMTLLVRLMATAALRDGFLTTGVVLKDLAFPAPFVLSMPFWLMKGTSWRWQTAILGVTMVLLIVISAQSHGR
jgi:hypothetical protein